MSQNEPLLFAGLTADEADAVLCGELNRRDTAKRYDYSHGTVHIEPVKAPRAPIMCYSIDVVSPFTRSHDTLQLLLEALTDDEYLTYRHEMDKVKIREREPIGRKVRAVLVAVGAGKEN